MYNTIVTHVNEIWTKGKNRQNFLRVLKKHIDKIAAELHDDTFVIRRDGSKFVITSPKPFHEHFISALQKVPGIHSFDLVRVVPCDFNAVLPVALDEIQRQSPTPKTFRIVTHRSNKQFPMHSMEISRQVGAHILRNIPDLKAKMDEPEFTIHIRVLQSGIFISSQHILGVGGLPIGMTGQLLTLLSGGFDSPVASYLLSRRGAEQTFIFFHAYPLVGNESKTKVIELTKVLSQYQVESPVYIVPFGNVQKLMADKCKPAYRTLFFRRLMLQCAELLANAIGAEALVTGDSLSQVSSQTLKNISMQDKCVELSILRPLIGFNKIEILNLAKTIGTHDISVIPHDDACSLLAPEHPTTNADRGYWRYLLDTVDARNELREMLLKAEVVHTNFRGEIFTTEIPENIRSRLLKDSDQNAKQDS